MNFNMQQSHIQMQQVPNPADECNFQMDPNQNFSSPRKRDNSSAMENAVNSTRDVSPTKKKKINMKKGQINIESRGDLSTNEAQNQSLSPPKVKKVKISKITLDSQGKGNGRNVNAQSQHQFLIQEISTNPLQQQLQIQQQQQLNTNPMLSPHHHQQQLPFNYRLRVAQIEKETSINNAMKNSSQTQLNQNIGTARRNQVQEQFNTQNGSRLGESDSKLARKGERPTVAQILDLNHAESQWMNIENTPDNVNRRKGGHRSIQPKSQVLSAEDGTTQQVVVRANNATNIQSAGFFNATSNFEQMQNYLGNMTQPQTVKQNKMKGASQLFLQENINMQRSPHSQQAKLLNPIKQRQFGVQSEVYQSAFDNNRLISPDSQRASQLRSHASQGPSRTQQQQQNQFQTQHQRALHNSQAAHAFLQSQAQQQFQDQAQQQYLPYFVDYDAISPHNRFAQQMRDNHGLQLPAPNYSRLQQLQQNNAESYHQVGGGDLPVISVTSSQLANLITQAAQNRQIQDQRQMQDRQQLQQSPTKHHTQQPMSPQAAFRYEENRMNDQMALTIQINERDRQQFQNNQNNGIYLPSLQQQMNTTLQSTNNYNRQMNSNIVSQQQIITQPAPVTKMRLCSRGGKSVPRGSARTDTDPLIEHQNAYRNKSNYIQQMAPQQQVAVQQQKQLPPGYAATEVEASSAGQGDNDQTFLDVNDLTNYVMQQNLRQTNAGTDTGGQSAPMSATNEVGGQHSRRLPPQHMAKLRLQQPSTTTAGAGTSATPQQQMQVTSSRTAVRQEGLNSSKTGQYVKQSGPLSDLIMTSQTNLAPSQQQHRHVVKGRNKSQVNVIELQGPSAMQTEQSNSQIPAQSSLDVDGGVPYESKVATAMAMQNLQRQETEREYGREGAGQGGGNSGLGQPSAGARGKKKKVDRGMSNSSAGERGEQYIGANAEAGSRRSAVNSASPDPGLRIGDQSQPIQPAISSAKKAKGVMGVGQKVLHARPAKSKAGGPPLPPQPEQRLTQAQQQATFGKRQYSQAPPAIQHIMQQNDQQLDARLPIVVGTESGQGLGGPGTGQAVSNNQHVQNQIQLRRGQFERKTTLGPSAIPAQFQIQQNATTAQQQQMMNQSQRDMLGKMQNAQIAASTTGVGPSATKQVGLVAKQPGAAQPSGEETSLATFGLLQKQLTTCCTKYFKKKNISRMTPRRYRDGVSTRILVAKETFLPKRAKLPVLLLNLDGGLGYWDEAKTYVFKERGLGQLISLSHNFRIVAYSAEPKTLIKRLGQLLAEYSRPFCFDALYQFARKPHQQRVNISQVLLDFSDEEEEDLDLFACSSVVMVTVDKQVLNQKFETMDLRELLDFDKEYLTGAKAPLIVRVPHARLRSQTSFCFDGIFQILITLLVSSRLKNFETPSFFSYNDRTRLIRLPTKEPCMCPVLLPDKLKFIEKSIQASKSTRFVMGECPYGFHVHKGFKRLTEAFCLNGPKPEWLDFHMRYFKPLLPVRHRLQKITQKTLQGAVPPTGKRLMVRCLTEEANKRYQNFSKKNENVRKHIRRYRGRYWAVNQIEDINLEEEQADVVGELEESKKPLDKNRSAIVDTAVESGVASGVEPQAEAGVEVGDRDGAADSVSDGDDGVPTSPSRKKDVRKIEDEGGECSSASESQVSSDSEGEQYVEDAQPIKYKIIDVKLQDTEAAFYKKPTINKNWYDPHKPIKLECRKTRCKAQALIDMCSKRQNAMMFMTSQAQHLVGAQSQQIENQVAELVTKLNEAEKAGKREVCNYEF